MALLLLLGVAPLLGLAQEMRCPVRLVERARRDLLFPVGDLICLNSGFLCQGCLAMHKPLLRFQPLWARRRRRWAP